MIKPDYFLSYKIMIPFIAETKIHLKQWDEYKYIENVDGTPAIDSRIMVGVSGISKFDSIEKRPQVFMKRSAIMRQRALLSNVAETFKLDSDKKSYGEALKFNVNFKIVTREAIENEIIGSYLFWAMEWNKKRFHDYGINDVYFNYFSDPVATEGAGDEKVNSWIGGINAEVTIHESYFLAPFQIEEAAKEYKQIVKLAHKNMTFKK